MPKGKSGPRGGLPGGGRSAQRFGQRWGPGIDPASGRGTGVDRSPGSEREAAHLPNAIMVLTCFSSASLDAETRLLAMKNRPSA